MNWLGGLAWVAIMVPMAAIVHKGLHAKGSGLTPLAVLYAIWIFVTFLYFANPFDLDRLPARAVVALVSAAVSFTLGYGIILLSARRVSTTVSDSGAAEPQSNHAARQLTSFRRAWVLCLIMWLLFFAVYLTQIRAYTGDGLHALLYSIRTSLSSTDSPPSGFYYFYFAQIVVTFGAILRIRTGHKMYLWWAVAALLSLVLTSGRTNAIVAIASWAFVIILDGRHKVGWHKISTIVFVSICIFATFAFLGNTLGKTYNNSELHAAYGDNPPVPSVLAQPLFYISGPIPYFGQLTNDPGGVDRGANLGRPLLQLASVLDSSIIPPPKIQQFLRIPFQTNLGTYLSPIWRDFGILGIVFVNAVLGALVATSWVLWRRKRSPGTLAITAVMMVFCLSSVLDAGFTELWFIVFLLIVITSSRPRRRSAYPIKDYLNPVAVE